MKKINLFYLFYLVIMGLFFHGEILHGKILLSSIILYLLAQIFYYRKNQIFVLLIIYSLTFFIYLIPYYFGDTYYAIQHNLITVSNTNKLIFIQSLFTCFLFLFLKIPQNWKIKNNIKSNKENRKIFYFCFFIMIYICFFKLKGATIFFSKYGDSSVNNSFLEYYLIFFIIAYRYIKNKKLELSLCLFSLFYSFRLLLYGLRLAALFQLILIFVFYFENKIKTKWIVTGSIFIFVLFSFLAFYRVGVSTNNLSQVLGVVEKDGIKWLQTTQGDVWMSSSMYLDLKLNGIFDTTARLKSIVGFWLSMVMPSKYVFTEAYFRNYAQQFYVQKVGGGGITAIYLYMWYGYLGIFLFARFLSKNINKAYQNRGSIYGVFLMVIFVRWYSYNILIVFKMGFYLILLDFILKKLFSRSKIKKIGVYENK